MVNSSFGTENSLLTKELPSEGSDAEQDFESLQLILAQVQKAYKIKGFILKNSARALIDLNNEDVVGLALLSAELFGSSAKLFKVTGAGQLNHVVLKGECMTLLCLGDGENQLSIFLDKTVDSGFLDRIVKMKF